MIDLGVVDPGLPQPVHWELRNLRGTPVCLSAVQAGCACMEVTEWPRESVAAGASFEVRGLMHASPGRQSQSAVTLLLDGQSTAAIVLFVKATGRIDLQAAFESARLHLGTVEVNGSISKSVGMSIIGTANLDDAIIQPLIAPDSPVEVLSCEFVGPSTQFVGDLRQRHARLDIRVHAGGPSGIEQALLSCEVSTGGRVARAQVLVVVEVTGDYSVSPSAAYVGIVPLRGSRTVEFRIRRLDESSFRLSKRSSSDTALVEIESRPVATEGFLVALTLQPGTLGPFQGSVDLVATDASGRSGTVHLRYAGVCVAQGVGGR